MADNISSSFSYLSTAGSRFTGLASGMDIESMVEKLMKAESAKMEKLQQQKQKYEWQRDAYRNINTKLETFHKDSFDQFGLQKNFLTQKATVSDTSKVDVTTDSSAVGALNISSVTSLATVGSKTTNSITTNVVNGSHKLSDFGISGNANSAGGGSFKITVEGATDPVTINYTKDDTIDSFLSKLVAAGVKEAKITSDGKLSVGSGTHQLDATGKNFFSKLGFNTTSSTLSGDVEQVKTLKANLSTQLKDLKNGIASDGYVTLNVLQKDGTMKETSVKYSKTDTIDTFMKTLNGSGAGVTTVFNNGSMSITSSATGKVAGGSVQVITSSDTTKTDNGKIFTTLGFLSSDTGMITNGTNAEYTINGITKESTSNIIKESGYTVTLKKQFAEGDGTVSITSTPDTDAMFDKIKSFIDLYNGLVDSLNTPIKEKKNYSYSPLTDAQKAEMNEGEVKKWEEKAKQGLLRNDSSISNVLSQMRGALYTVNTATSSPYNALFNIGITTTAAYSDGGKIEIKDEAKLREAIANDPEAVAKLFTDSNTGVVAKLRTAAKSAITQISDKAGKEGAVENTFTLGKNLISIEDRIKSWKDRLETIEERYFKQFSAMETAIQKANSQSSLFTTA